MRNGQKRGPESLLSALWAEHPWPLQVDLLDSLHFSARRMIAGDKMPLGAEQEGAFAGFHAEGSAPGLCLSTMLSSDGLRNQTLIPAQAMSLCSLIVLIMVKRGRMDRVPWDHS